MTKENLKQIIIGLAVENKRLYPESYENNPKQAAEDLAVNYFEHRTDTEVEEENALDVSIEDYKEWCLEEIQEDIEIIIEMEGGRISRIVSNQPELVNVSIFELEEVKNGELRDSYYEDHEIEHCNPGSFKENCKRQILKEYLLRNNFKKHPLWNIVNGQPYDFHECEQAINNDENLFDEDQDFLINLIN